MSLRINILRAIQDIFVSFGHDQQRGWFRRNDFAVSVAVLLAGGLVVEDDGQLLAFAEVESEANDEEEFEERNKVECFSHLISL